MQSGSLDRQIDIQQVTHNRDSDGGDNMSWSNLYTGVPCQAIPMRAIERFTSSENREDKVYRFIIRYMPNLKSDYRINYQGQYYKILGFAEIGRYVGLEITAELLQSSAEHT